MERRSFFAWLLGLSWGTRQVAAKPDLSAAQALFDDAIVLKPQITRLGDDCQVLIGDGERLRAANVLRVRLDRANQIAWLTGLPADVEAFCRLYQDKLWPGWQQHTLANEVERAFVSARKGWAAGTGGVGVGTRQGRDAYDQSLKAWTKPIVIV